MRLGAASSRIDLQDGPEIVSFLSEHIAQFQILDLSDKGLELSIRIFLSRLVFFGELQQNLQILIHFLNPVVGIGPELHASVQNFTPAIFFRYASASFGSSQNPAPALCCCIAATCSFLEAMSKTPPQRIDTLTQVSHLFRGNHLP